MPTTANVALRIPTEDLEEIDRRAKARGQTRTAYMIATALDSQRADTPEDKTFADHERRLERLETYIFELDNLALQDAA